jgi:hypothetical protein
VTKREMSDNLTPVINTFFGTNWGFYYLNPSRFEMYYATLQDTFVTLQDTFVTSQDTFVTSQDTFVTSQDTFVSSQDTK